MLSLLLLIPSPLPAQFSNREAKFVLLLHHLLESPSYVHPNWVLLVSMTIVHGKDSVEPFASELGIKSIYWMDTIISGNSHFLFTDT